MYVYDTTSMESFVRVRDWINLAQQEGQGEQFVSVLVATKTDLASERVSARLLVRAASRADAPADSALRAPRSSQQKRVRSWPTH
jgi:GTPase SAR1 family protein